MHFGSLGKVVVTSQVRISPSRAWACQDRLRSGGGAGLFFLVKSTRTLLLRGRRACLYPSVYLDAHGEEDEFLKRGRPLFLSEERVAALEELWVQSAFDYDSLAAQNSRLGSDFY